MTLRNQEKKHLDQIFNQLKHSTANDVLQQRTRFLVDIVKEKRRNGWPQKKGDQMKTLEEIHQDYAQQVGTRINAAPRCGQPTFDEILTDATNRESKLLKFALSGGCAIRNPQSNEEMEPRANMAIMPDLINNLLMDSSAVIDESQQPYDEFSISDNIVVEEEAVTLLEEKEIAALKENGTFIRNFLSELEDDEKKANALTTFQTTIKKMGWTNKVDLVFNFFNFDVRNVDESGTVGTALQSLLEIGYVTKADLKQGLDEFCEWFTSTEMDVPFLVQYFGGLTLKLIQAGTVTLAEVNEHLKKDV